jgi:transcriptional regulator with XRE-family HTH domain
VERGLTQTQIAEASGLPQTLVSRLERGESLTVDNLAAFAAALGIPLSRVFEGL